VSEKTAAQLNMWIQMLLYGILFFLPFSKAAIGAFFGIFFILFMVRKAKQPDWLFLQTPSALALFVFIFFCALSLIKSGQHIEKSAIALVFKWVRNFLLFFMISSFLDGPRARRVLFFFMCVSVLLGLDALTQKYFGFEFFRHRTINLTDQKAEAVRASFNHFNDFGAFLIFPLSIGFAILMSGRLKKKFVVIIAALVVLLCSSLIFTLSRGAWIGFFMAMVFLIFLLRKYVWGVVLSGVFAGVFLLIPAASQRLFFTFSPHGDSDRFAIWKATWGMISENPLLGKGIGTFMAHFSTYAPTLGIQYAHNCFLQIWAECGVFALLSFLVFVALVFYRGIRVFRQKRDYWVAGLLSGLAGFLVHSFFDTQLYSLQLSMLFWFMAGVLDSYSKDTVIRWNLVGARLALLRQRAIGVFSTVIYWMLILFPFTMAIAPGVTYTCMGLLCFAFLMKKLLLWQSLFKKTAISIPFFLWMAVSFLSFRNTLSLSSSLHGLGKIFEALFVWGICAEEIRDRKHFFRIIASIVVGASLASVDALWQMVFGKDFIRGNELILNIGLKRATAAFPNANVLGVYLSALAPVIIGLALFYWKGMKKAITVVLGCIVALGILVTFSRGTALALYCALLILGIVRRNKIMVGLLILLVAIAPVILPSQIKTWAKSIHYNPVVFMLNADRISIYRNTVNMIEHHPIIGVGFNTFSLNYPLYKLSEPEGAETGAHMYAHNHFLQMAGEIGLLGLGVFLWLLWCLFRSFGRIWRQGSGTVAGVVALALIAGISAFLINGLTETSLYYSRVAHVFWFLIGLLLSMPRSMEEKKSP